MLLPRLKNAALTFLLPLHLLLSNISSATPNHSIPGPWQLRGRDQFGVELRAFCRGEDGFVAVGHMGFVGHSRDAVSWTSRQLRPLEHYDHLINTPKGFLRSGYYSQGSFYRGAIWHSEDSIRWTRVLSTDLPIEQLAHGPSGYLAIQRVEERIGHSFFRSLNGIDWERIQIQTQKPTSKVRLLHGESSGYAILLETGELLQSEDGRNWKTFISQVESSNRWVTFTRSGMRWVGASSDGRLHASDDDGETWETSGIATNESITSIAAHGGQVVAVSEAGRIFSRIDSGSWTAQRSPAPDSSLHHVSFVHDRWILSGKFGVLLVSTNAIDWTVVSEDFESFKEIAATEQGFVAIAFNRTKNSSDGTNWVYNPSPNFVSIAAGQGRFVATAKEGIYASEDGFLWVPKQEFPTRTRESTVRFSSDTFIAVESFEGLGRIYRSTNGLDWSTVVTNVGPPVSVLIDLNPLGLFRRFRAGNEVWGWWAVGQDAWKSPPLLDWGMYGVTGDWEAKSIFSDGTILNLSTSPSPISFERDKAEINPQEFTPPIFPEGMSYADDHFFLFGTSPTNHSPRFYCAHHVSSQVWEECSPYLSRIFVSAASNSKSLVLVGAGILQVPTGSSLAYQPTPEIVRTQTGLNLEWHGPFLTLNRVYVSENLRDWKILQKAEHSDVDYSNLFTNDNGVSIPITPTASQRYFKIQTTTYRDWIREWQAQ